MRIISQDGFCDIPYEQAVVAHIDGTVVAYALNDLGSSDYIQLASYSTEEKAIKAMEMCREYYDSIFFEPQSEIFQFPAEEEVE